MDFSQKQNEAIDAVMAFFADDTRKEMCIAGYAGTGKTTIAKAIADRISAQFNGEYYPQFVTFTGKAASVLRVKGCQGCTTIHSMIYSSADKCKKRIEELRIDFQRLKYQLEQGKISQEAYASAEKKITLSIDAERKNLSQPKFFLNENSDIRDHKLVIVDEYSMLDERLVTDLKKLCKKILFLGDPGQLPPVGKKAYNFTPDIFLDEIHRQAMDSPILRAATQVREKGYLNLCDDGDFRYITKEQLGWEQYKAASQIICGKNDSAKTFNRKFREKLGYTSPLPMAGEKVMAFKNNHDLLILNGVVYNVTKDATINPDSYETAYLDIKGDEIDYMDLNVWSRRFEYRKIDPEPEQLKDLEHFDFCYAITAHKSQGSEFDNVIIWDDGMFYNKPQDRKRWLYTSITRAAKTCTLVRGG